jgi:putative ABC transport system permease protein
MLRLIGKALRRLRTWSQPTRFERELDEELTFHLEMQTRWHESQGHDHTTAAALAAREFGGATRHREAVFDARGFTWALDVGRDVRFALRSYARTPSFTIVALLTLALGIGTTTAAFSIIDGVLLRDLPYPDADRIVSITGRDSLGNTIGAVSAPNYYDWREQARSFEAMAIYATSRRPLLTGADAFRIDVASVSADFFRVMRIPAAIGRTLTPADAESDSPVTVVSHGFWVRRFGDVKDLPPDPIRIGPTAYRVVGVLPPGREFPEAVDAFIPYAFGSPWRTASRNNINFGVLARLAPGVSIERARADMRTVTSRVHAQHREDLYGVSAGVVTLKESLVGPSEAYLRLLAGAVIVVLLVACANLANANLARGAIRGRELAVRTAIGAGFGRLVRQLLVESVVLAVIGGVVGMALAWSLVRVVSQTSAVDLPRVAQIAVNAPVLGFALVLSVLVGLAVGLAPVFQVSRGELYSTIAAGGRNTVSRGRTVSRDLLIGLELALAIVLLVGAGLLIRSFRTVLSRDVGFVADGAIAAELSLPPDRYSGPRSVPFYDGLFSAIRSIPGVTAVGVTNFLPLGGSATGFIEVEGQSNTRAGAGYRVVSDDYFTAMGIPLVRGRFFHASDDSGSVRVTLINQRMAERYWPGEDPIGKRFKATSMEWKDTPWLTVIGVVAGVRHFGLEAEVPVEHYVLYRQRPEYALTMSMVVRGRVDPSQMMRTVRDRVRAIDRDIPVEVSTLGDRVDRSVAERRFIMTVLTAFGALALGLAAVGVYGVLSFSVAQRTREIAVRMALGAGSARVLSLVVGHAVRVSLVATVIGLLAARGVSKLMAALLFEVSPADPQTYAVVSGVLIAVSIVAAYAPARRAATVDPMVALRSDN